jgi:hypothetical protein
LEAPAMSHEVTELRENRMQQIAETLDLERLRLVHESIAALEGEVAGAGLRLQKLPSSLETHCERIDLAQRIWWLGVLLRREWWNARLIG